MSRIIMFLFLAALALSCKDEAGKMFEVKGSVKNSEARMIYLEETPIGNMQRVVIDSADLDNNGNFSLSAPIKEESLYNLRVDDEPTPFATIINDTEGMTVHADYKNPTELYTVEGSPASQALKDYLRGSLPNLRALSSLDRRLDSMAKSGAPDNALAPLIRDRNEVAVQLKNYAKQTMSGSQHPGLSFFILGSYQNLANNPSFNLQPFSNEEVAQVIDEANSKFPSHEGIMAIQRSFHAQMEQNRGWVGKEAPEISLADHTGKPVKLSSFRGKYVLVDFWASWCKPCRAENPNVVAAFRNYRNRNFTILGVSLDQNKDSWLKAIQKDSLSWTHISDLKYWSSAVVPTYKITQIPYNVLVDPQGKVIAQDLRGENLGRTLGEILP